jgi:cytochrome c oxidase assembly protein subunit 15
VIPDHWSGAIAIHFTHRVGALLVTMAVLTLFTHVRSRYRDRPELMRPAALIVALVAAQVTLGALTVLSRRDPWINSFHVVCGALVLTTSLVLTLRSWRGSFTETAVRLKPDTTEEGAAATRSTVVGVGSVRLQPDRRGHA